MTTAHPEHPDPVLSTRDLPRGSTAVDRSGHTLITWPDGQYGYVGERKFPAVLPGVSPSSSTGPYTVTRTGLTAPDCDLIHAGIPVDEVEDLGRLEPEIHAALAGVVEAAADMPRDDAERAAFEAGRGFGKTATAFEAVTGQPLFTPEQVAGFEREADEEAEAMLAEDRGEAPEVLDLADVPVASLGPDALAELAAIQAGEHPESIPSASRVRDMFEATDRARLAEDRPVQGPGTPLPPDALADKLDAALKHQRGLNAKIDEDPAQLAAIKSRIHESLFGEAPPTTFEAEDEAKLDRLAAGMRKFAGLHVELGSGVDPARGQAIKAALVARGVNPDRITFAEPLRVEDTLVAGVASERGEAIERMVDAMLQRQAFLAGLEQRTDVEDAELRRLVSWFKIGAVQGAPIRKAEIVDLVRTVDRLGVERRDLLFRLGVKSFADLPPLDEASREELERFVPADHVGGGDRGQLPFEVRTFGRCLSIRVGFDALARMAEEAPNPRRRR